MKTLHICSLVGTAALSLGFAAPAFAYPGQALSRGANVTMAQARKKALRAYPGRITSGELERERGGSGLRFSFDVSGRSGLREIGIDAKTGRLLENSKEGPNAD